jgi:hypothetical protein
MSDFFIGLASCIRCRDFVWASVDRETGRISLYNPAPVVRPWLRKMFGKDRRSATQGFSPSSGHRHRECRAYDWTKIN